MVTKVVTDKDVDNVTIIINQQNKLEAKLPENSGSVVIEEVTGITELHDGIGNFIESFFTIIKGEQRYPITKVGRIAGTNWLVFQAEGLLQTKPTPPVTEPPVGTTEWTPVLYCEQNPINPVYDETYTGVQIQGSLPADVTEVIITLQNGDSLRFPVNLTGIYKYKVDPSNYHNYGRIPEWVTPITATSDLQTKAVNDAGRCSFATMPK